MAVFVGICGVFVALAMWGFYYFCCTNEGRKSAAQGTLESARTDKQVNEIHKEAQGIRSDLEQG